MDERTRQQRRRNKELAKTKTRNGLSQYEAKGLGRRNRYHETFAVRQCEVIVGGKEFSFRKKRANPKPGQDPTYMVTIIKGGHRCPKTATYGTKCPEHSGSAK